MPSPLVNAAYMRDWGKHAHGSPLYAELVEVVAKDAELLRVMNRIQHLPPPNLMFGAVQYLLMDGEDGDLARHYPSIVEDPIPPAGAGPKFRSFVLAHEEEIVEVGNTRYTQTNECRRCVALLPMVMMAGFRAFHLIDVGASAGLNLGLDEYGYSYNDKERRPGRPMLEAESRGVDPTLADIEVFSRTGLDLNPLDPADPGARRWLDALIWPEHVERRARLRSALEMISNLDIEMISGNALKTLPGALDRLPAGEPAVVMSSFTLNQFAAAERDRLESIVSVARTARPVHRVSMGEALDKADDWARLVVDDGRGATFVGQAHPHGEWIELYR
jgi:hypothetical protein